VAIEGLRRLLDGADDFALADSESGLPDALQSVRQLQPAVFLLDKAFGVHAVMDCLRTLGEDGGKTAMVVWGESVTEAEALRFLQSGATAVIRKTAPLDALLQCLGSAARGETWVEPDVLNHKELPSRLARTALTAREMQVMELVERGLKNKEIAATLGIRTGTVKIHLKHIFEKTGIRGRYGLALSGLKAKGLLAYPVPGM
jgi:DNA-binding NarL/FixJ family response regulator